MILEYVLPYLPRPALSPLSLCNQLRMYHPISAGRELAQGLEGDPMRAGVHRGYKAPAKEGGEGGLELAKRKQSKALLEKHEKRSKVDTHRTTYTARLKILRVREIQVCTPQCTSRQSLLKMKNRPRQSHFSEELLHSDCPWEPIGPNILERQLWRSLGELCT